MTTYLSKQKKGDLIELAKQAGVTGTDDMLKDEIVAALDSTLREDSSKYISNPVFSEFYKRGGSPVNRAPRIASMSLPISALADGEDKTARRRKTIVARIKDEVEGASSGIEEAVVQTSNAVVTRTPKAVQRLAERVPLPPSPQVVTEYITRSQEQISNTVADLYEKTGTTEHIANLRDTASTVVSVHVLSLLVEAVGLQRTTFPWKYAFTLPALPLVKLNPLTIHLPNFFVLLYSDFWAPSALWLATSLFVPLLFAYFFNFSYSIKGQGQSSRSSSTAYKFDPLTYNVSKALLTWLVFSQGFRYGNFWDPATVTLVDHALYGGHQSIYVSCAIGALASIYEAILQKQ